MMDEEVFAEHVVKDGDFCLELETALTRVKAHHYFLDVLEPVAVPSLQQPEKRKCFNRIMPGLILKRSAKELLTCFKTFIISFTTVSLSFSKNISKSLSWKKHHCIRDG